jgi:malic enzyme
VQQVFPDCCIHFEDWKGTDAIRLLNRYADKILYYNDDIQGTASVTLAGLTTALQIVGAPLTDQRILFLGAGSAGIGIAKLIAAAMQAKGLSQHEAHSRISMFDIDGLLEPHLSGGRTRNVRGAAAADHRRMLHRRRSGLRRSDRPRPPRKGHAISGPGQHFGNGNHNGNARRRVHVR